MKPTDITARVPGMMTLEEVAVLMEYAARAPGTLIEVGAYLGLSTCALAAGAQHPVYSVDPFETRRVTSPLYPAGFEYRAENEGAWRANVERMGLTARVKLLKNASQDAARRWREPAGLVLLDADPNDSEADVAAWSRHVMSGGYLLLHDKNEPVVAAEIGKLEASGEWQHLRTVNLLAVFRRVSGVTAEVHAAIKEAVTDIERREKLAKKPERKAKTA